MTFITTSNKCFTSSSHLKDRKLISIFNLLCVWISLDNSPKYWFATSIMLICTVLCVFINSPFFLICFNGNGFQAGSDKHGHHLIYILLAVSNPLWADNETGAFFWSRSQHEKGIMVHVMHLNGNCEYWLYSNIMFLWLETADKHLGLWASVLTVCCFGADIWMEHILIQMQTVA